MLYSIVAALVIILDQAVKNWVSNTLFAGDVVTFIPGVISLVNIQNDGAAFSFLSGSGARIYFIILTGIFTVLVIIALATNFISGRLSRWSLVLVTAGGLANCIDRIIYGAVQDMFKVELFNFAIFNVADIFITVFAIVFAIAMIFERQEDDDDEYYDEDEEEEKPKREKKERKPLLGRFKKDASLDEDDEEDDYDDRRPAPRKSRAAKRSKYEEEYEQYKAQRTARSQPTAAPAQQKVTDPFAEWEKASASVAAQRVNSPASKAMDVSPAPARKPSAPQPVRQAAPQPQMRQAAAQPARPQTPVAPAAPAPRPQAPAQAAQPAPTKPASGKDGFDLDDILAEFK